MSANPVQPLRITKSPAKGNHGVASPRSLAALTEISPMERRRNSPSWNQATKKMIVSRESSPFDSTTSPRGFRQSKIPSSSPFNENAYQRPESPSVVRHRTSIENLKRASRVKNSSMFVREQMGEYDPSSPVIVERPLAAGRPLATQSSPFVQPRGIDSVVHKDAPHRGHRRGESQTQIPLMQAGSLNSKLPSPSEKSPSPVHSRNQPSPSKSSMAKNHNTFPRNFDPATADLSEDDECKVSPERPLRRQAKSVTFDVAPPQVNEYEMATPDPSVTSASREGSYDDYYDDDEDLYDMDHAMGGQDEDSFDESLEDTEKTPVVLPEDWRGVTPDVADTTLAAKLDDVFNTKEDDAQSTPSKEWNKFRTASVESDGDSRPLPPVPNFNESGSRRNSGNILERVHNAHRTLPTPPQAASISKTDILNMKSKSLGLEDRLRLMGLGNETTEKSSPDQASREKARLQRHGLGIHVHEDEPTSPNSNSMADFKLNRISRESILKNIKGHKMEQQRDDMIKLASSPPRHYNVDNLDPDVPIPSREGSADEVVVKEEPEDDFTSLYSIPALLTGTASPPVEERSGSVVRYSAVEDHEDFTDSYLVKSGAQRTSQDAENDDGPPTPRADAKGAVGEDGHIILPEFSSLDESDFRASLHSYIGTGSDNFAKQRTTPIEHSNTSYPTVEEYMTRDISPVDDDDAGRAETPDSVLHHPIMPITAPQGRNSPVIPEPLATVKAPGTALKTRPSVCPADLETMAATRRQVSGSFPPPVPEKSPKRSSFSATIDNTNMSETDSIDRAVAAHKKRRESFKPELDFAGDMGEDLSLNLDKEFNRVIESSKLGYLMRQNTKVIVAKRNFSNETNSVDGDRPASADDVLGKQAEPGARKPSHERAKSWTTEPWNGKVRRKSLRSVDKKVPTGPAPPLPGQQSALEIVPEDQSLPFEEFEDGVERGRLFVKVAGVKDLNLPLPQNERTWFSLTLDNGLHCVTTSRLELGRTAPIGQEFELVVLSELEFQLSLQVHISPPANLEGSPNAQSSKIPKSPTKRSAFSRFLASPKKRREQERVAQQQRDEEERLRRERRAAEAAARAAAPPTAWDLLHDIAGEDGSFARAYVCAKNYEDSCFGRPIKVDVPLFNEWAVEDPNISSSMKSKRGDTVLRRPPYQIGNLTLQMLYVPRPKGAKEEDMPKSMNGCIREMSAAENAKSCEFEGFLSQQGGDCPYWRRRFFKLSGTNLTAFHETTRQPRTKISLSRATKLIDDKTSLLKPTETKKGGRRKSAFADEDQAYMFVEEGFRIRFANGEAIDFYADSAAEKDNWMAVLSTIVGIKDRQPSSSSSKSWCDVVLNREEILRQRAEQVEKVRPRSHGMAQMPPQIMSTKSQPSSPVKREAPVAIGGRQQPRPRSQIGGNGSMLPPQSRLSARRQHIKSMIF